MRYLPVVALAAVAVIAGCAHQAEPKTSTSHAVPVPARPPAKSTISTPPAALTTPSPVPLPTTDDDPCIALMSANQDLFSAATTSAARTAADTMEQHDPPAAVGHAIEDVVANMGNAAPADATAIDTWIGQVCPMH